MTEKSGTFTSSVLGAAGEKYTFTVLASAGTCKDVKASTVVTVGNGEKVGTLTFTEAHNDSSGVQFNVATAKSINFILVAIRLWWIPNLLARMPMANRLAIMYGLNFQAK